MASSITVSSYGAYHGDYQGRYLYVSCTQTRNTAANTSTINWTLYSTGGTSTYYTVGPTYVYINGSQVYYREQKSWRTQEFPAATGSTSGSTTVSHNADGTKTITVELVTAVYNDGTGSSSKSWTLDAIQRSSVIANVPSFNIEDGLSCTFTKYVDSYTQTLKLSYGSTDIATFSNYTSGTTVTLTNAQILAAYNAMGTNKSGDFTFTLTTYDGSTSRGNSTKNGTGTCAGTSDIRVSGVYKRALPWVNDNGTWKKALGFSKDEATWKRGI